MATTTRYARRSKADVFAALVDPYTYPEWLVGCRAIRDLDGDWPEPGSRFHHRVGLLGPLTVEDNTKILSIDEPNRLELEVRARPFGRGRVVFTLTDVGTGAEPVIRIDLDEVPIGLMAPTKPVLDPLTHIRNQASLNALVAYLNAPDHVDGTS